MSANKALIDSYLGNFSGDYNLIFEDDVEFEYVNLHLSSPGQAFPVRYGRSGRGPETYVDTFLKDISLNLLKLPADDSDLKDECAGYCFPDESDVKNFYENISFTINDNDKVQFAANEKKGEYDKSYNGNLANENREKADLLIDSLVDDIKSSSDMFSGTGSCQRIITGKVGSGKSTFIEYLYRSYRKKFIGERVILSLLTYNDLKIFSGVKNIDYKKYDWEKYFESLIIWKIIKSVVDFPDVVERLDSDYYLFYKDYRQISLLDEGVDNYENIDRIIESEYRWFMGLLKKSSMGSFQRILKSDHGKFEIFLNFLVQEGYSFLVFVDGLDQVSIGGIRDGKFRFLFDELINKTLKRSYLCGNENISVHTLLTFRACTSATYRQLASDGLHKKVINHPLVSVSIDKIIRRAIWSISKDKEKKYYSEIIEDLGAYLFLLIDNVMECLEIEDYYSLVMVFNRNMRSVIRFIIEVNRAFINRFNPSKYRGLSELLQVLIDEAGNNFLKPYEVVEILLIQEKVQFENYYDILVSRNLDFDTIMNKSYERGFVDNCYSYTPFDADGGTPLLLVKLRIMKYLSVMNYQPLENIVNFLELLNYNCPVDSILKILLGASFLKVRADSKGRYIYNVTGLGQWVLNKMCFNNTYVEYVLQKNLWPSVLSVDIHSMTRSSTFEWVTYSMANIFVFYNYLNYVESIEEKLVGSSYELTNVLGDDWRISDKLMKSIEESTTRRVVTISGVAFDINKTNEAIDSIVSRWRNIGCVK